MERSKQDFTGLRLGGAGGDAARFVKACFDDVALYIPDENEELPALSSLTGKESKQLDVCIMSL